MRENRATQTSGLVRALCSFHPRGLCGRDESPLLLQLFVPSFPFISPRKPHPVLRLPPTPKLSFPSQQCLNRPTEHGSPRVIAHLPNLCRLPLCKCVLAPLPFCTLQFPIYPSIGSFRGRSRPPLCLSCSPSGMDSPLSPHRFSRGRRLRHVHDPFV